MVAISVTIPVYNVEKYLSRCLGSILSQSFKDFEIICVDDGSTDNSLQILKEYSKKFSNIKVIQQENQGLSVARNTALKYATGKYTMFIDSDDFIFTRWAFEKLYKYAELHNSDVVVFDFVRGTSDKKNITRQNFPNIIKRYGDTTFNAFIAEPFVYRFISVATWCKFYRTDLVKGIEFVPDLNNQDVVHWAEVYTKASKINYYPEPFYFYTIQREGAITSTKGRKIFDVFRAFELAKGVLEKSGYFEKFRNIHYTHFCSNLINRLRKMDSSIRKEFINQIKDTPIEIDYEKFMQEGFFKFEEDNVKMVKFIKENKFKDIRRYLIDKGVWKK